MLNAILIRPNYFVSVICNFLAFQFSVNENWIEAMTNEIQAHIFIFGF
jgi:hypothetical protein